MRETSSKVTLSGVPETMLQTVYARAKETQTRGAVRDEKAVEIIRRLDYDFSLADKDSAMSSGVIARTIVLDKLVKTYLSAHPGAVAVNIACGLDTRCYRMQGYQHWYNLDLPETIAVREKLLPEKLVQKLDSYTDAEQAAKEQDSDWAVFLRRYIKRTVFYGVLMLGIVSLGDMLLLPLLEKTLSAAAWVSKAVTLCAVYLCIAMFVRPMLDAHSPQYTVLWAKKRSFRLPLIALSVIRVLLIVFIVFLPIRTVLGIHSLWILPLLAAAVLVAGHFGWFASAYLLVETRFLTNFNERLLQQYGDSNDATWLDEKMYVTELICPPEEAGKDLRALGWGRRYGANIIKIVRGKKEFDIPSGDMVLSEGDRLAVIGEKENLVSLRLSIGADAAEDIPTLHTYIAGEKALYTYTLDVAKNDHLAGSTIRDSGLRENYDCMILGLQRNLLPIIGPDVNFVIQRGDLVWLLGSHRMAEKALDDMEEA